ncbi:hypothetical protein KIN20_029405 [Parelaphostrongylus tenuis]|uniref:Uncharacterized protein n=1 Tax=Parelaphostrongylus tenuis TaxID=148309 RepID=A0AAD5WFJ1_PARTN|nr:hypothetical protein KIN20_029405 [Parelaphostrongylus tenuis]
MEEKNNEGDSRRMRASSWTIAQKMGGRVWLASTVGFLRITASLKLRIRPRVRYCVLNGPPPRATIVREDMPFISPRFIK